MKKTHAKTYIIIAIFLSIIGISIAYASLSQQLQIKTNTTVQSSQTSWNISYQPLNCEAYDYAKLGTMTVNGTTITLSGFALQTPSSLAYCYFNIINNGEINAKISSISGPNTVFTGSGSTKNEDEKLIKEHFFDGSFARWKTGNNWQILKNGDKVLVGETRTVVLSVMLDNTMTTLPTNPVNFSITYTINFEQA